MSSTRTVRLGRSNDTMTEGTKALDVYLDTGFVVEVPEDATDDEIIGYAPQKLRARLNDPSCHFGLP